MSGNRRMMAVIAAAFVVIAIGGGLLLAFVIGVANTNSRFICGFGAAIAAKPLAKKEAETAKEFRQRVRQTEDFVNGLSSDLKDCSVPTDIRIAHNSKKLLPKGVVPSTSPSSGNSKPGGSKRPPSGGLNPGGNPTAPVPTPAPPSLVNPLQPVCDALPDLGIPLSPICP